MGLGRFSFRRHFSNKNGPNAKSAVPSAKKQTQRQIFNNYIVFKNFYPRNRLSVHHPTDSIFQCRPADRGLNVKRRPLPKLFFARYNDPTECPDPLASTRLRGEDVAPLSLAAAPTAPRL